MDPIKPLIAITIDGHDCLLTLEEVKEVFYALKEIVEPECDKQEDPITWIPNPPCAPMPTYPTYPTYPIYPDTDPYKPTEIWCGQETKEKHHGSVCPETSY